VGKKKKYRMPFLIGIFTFVYLLVTYEAPLREQASLFTSALISPFKKPLPKDYRLSQLELENILLKNQISTLKHLTQEKNRILNISPESESSLFRPQKEIFCGRIVLKNKSTYDYTFWIDLGRKNCPAIGKNSPVCFGPHAIGVVEYVGARTARVRLISDPKLQPSVCAIRGSATSSWITDTLKALAQDERLQTDSAKRAFSVLTQQLAPSGPTQFLAKGYLEGIHRFQGKNLFKVSGFHKDFPLKGGDRLITSGLDGVFPKGLLVAKVVEILAHKPAELTYSLWAEPLYTPLDLPFVFILPPLDIAEDLEVQ